MPNKANSLSLEYGNTKISFFHLLLQPENALTSPLWHTHGYYEVHFSTKGTLEYTFSDRQVSLPRGEMLIIPPNTPHISQEIEETNGLWVISLSLTAAEPGDSCYKAFSSALESAALVPRPIPAGLLAEAQMLLDDLYSTVLGVCQLQSAAAEFVRLLFADLMDRDVPTGHRELPLSFLLENLLNAPFSLQEIAEITGYSKRHISRLIKKQHGMTLSQLRKNQKKEIG